MVPSELPFTEVVMPGTVLPHPLPRAFDELMISQGRALRANDPTYKTREAWQQRRIALRRALLEAMGPVPEKPCALEARALAVLKRPGYHIEKVVFQSRPDLWVTGNVYLPDP